jgi:hypothetical protein
MSNEPPRPRPRPELHVVPREDRHDTPVPPSEARDVEEPVVFSAPVVRAIFARLDEVGRRMDDRFDRHEDRTAMAVNTIARRQATTTAAVTSVSEGLADVSTAVLRLEDTVGVMPDPKAFARASVSDLTPEQVAEYDKQKKLGTGLCRQVTELTLNDLRQARAAGTRAGVVGGSVAAGVVAAIAYLPQILKFFTGD